MNAIIQRIRADSNSVEFNESVSMGPPAGDPSAKLYRIYTPRMLADLASQAVNSRKFPTRSGLKNFRAGACQRVLVRTADSVLVKSKRGKAPHFGNLVTCKGKWICPICDIVEMTACRGRLAECMAVHAQYGRELVMLTMTTSHSAGDCLNEFWERYNNACKAFWKARAVKRSLANRGRVSAVEYTYGERNGAHLHRHILLFVDRQIDPVTVKKELAPIWAQCCADSGLPRPNFARGLDFRLGDSGAGRYLTKVGGNLSKEFTKRQLKKGSDERFGVFDLLTKWDSDREANYRFRNLFMEFAGASWGRFRFWGVSDIEKLYSTELERRAALCMVEPEDDARIIATIGKDLWLLACRQGKRDEILRIASSTWNNSQDVEIASQAISDFILSLEVNL